MSSVRSIFLGMQKLLAKTSMLFVAERRLESIPLHRIPLLELIQSLAVLLVF